MKIAVVLFVFAFYLRVNNTFARWRRFKDGKFIIGALFPVTQGPECKVVRGEGLLHVEALVYTININSNGALSNGNNLGYDIRDSCSSPAIALKEALDILATGKDGAWSGNCSETQPAGKSCGVVAFVGPDFSNSAMVTSGLLSAYGIPQVGLQLCALFYTKLFHSLLCVENYMQGILINENEAEGILI